MINSTFFHQLYFKSTGHSFTNLGRLFLRMFIGLMIAQFGVRQLAGPSSPADLELIPVLQYDLHVWLIIVVELVCSFFIMIGLFTRLMIIPPFILMIVSCHEMAIYFDSFSMIPIALLSVPFLFMGLLFFLFLVGPGKISIDYFYSLYLISRHHNGKEEELEEV